MKAVPSRSRQFRRCSW